MFSGKIKNLFRKVIKATNAAVEMAKAAKEAYLEVREIYRAAVSAWSTFRA